MGFIFKLTIYLIILGLYVGGTYIYRPDINLDKALHSIEYWIVPLMLFYIVFNFTRILSGIINKLIVILILFGIANHFYPSYAQEAKNYVIGLYNDYFPSEDSIKRKMNNALTPKDGTKPKYQFDVKPNITPDLKPKFKKEDVSKPVEQNKTSDDNNEENLNDNNKNITNEIKELPGKIIEKLPTDAKNKLENAGVDINNPINTINNIQKSIQNKNEEFFK